MGLSARLATSFRSRVALRIFLLCALCSLLPTVVIGVAVYTRIAAAETRASHDRLRDLSKRYGALLHERLRFAEEALLDAVRQHHAGAPAQPRAQTSTLLRLDVTPMLGAHVGDGRRNLHHPDTSLEVVSEELYIVRHDGRPTAQLDLQVVNEEGTGYLVTGVLDPAYLWSDDAVATALVRLCVSTRGQPLGCSGADPVQGDLLSEKWDLYLRAHFGAADWTVTATEPRGASAVALESVRSGFPLLAGVSLLVALLIGAWEVRRTHGPLDQLLAGFRSMTRGRFVQVPLQARSDEYGQIGRAFNQVSRTLRRQFRLLLGFERMDRTILDHPAMEELAAAVLPRLPQMLGCRHAALLLSRPDGWRLHDAAAESGAVADGGAARGDEVFADSGSARVALARRHPDVLWQERALQVDGQVRGWLLAGVAGAAPAPRRVARQLRGVARRFAVALRNEDRETLLLRQAYYDELTGLANRRLLQDRVQQALREAEATQAMCAFLYLDVDRFKTINDSLGHKAGDDLLAELGRRLAAVVSPADTVARLGGDEFVILLRNTTAVDTVHAGERLLDALRKPLVAEGVTITTQASIGVAMSPVDGIEFDTLLRNADAAMYRGKAAGGGRVVFFEDQMNAQAVRRLQVESALRRAISEGGLELYYQPKVSLADGEFHGVEALMRWEDAGLGRVSPLEFVTVAEEAGLIRDLGRVALEQAVAFCRTCMDEGVPIGHVAVNVSMRQLQGDELQTLLARLLAQHRVPPAMLQIEVTESSVMQDVKHVRNVLQQIRETGVRIAIDDFGTGYSSLAVLQQLPVDLLKMDRAFVATVCESPRSLELVRAMLAVARALGMGTVAEGVETPAQALLLAQHGCDIAQGWLYGKAVPAAEIREVARGWIMAAPSQPWIMAG